MTPPLVAHIVHRLDYGGLENGLVNLLNGLPADHTRHAVICLTSASDFAARIRRPETALYELHKKPGKDFGAYLRLWRLLSAIRPAVVHTRNTGVIDCQLVARLAGVPVRIHGYHGWDVDDLNGDNPRRNRLRRLCDPSVTRYVVLSRQIREWLVGDQGVSEDRITRICNGVDVARFRPTAGRASDRPTLVVGTVGRLQPVKSQITLVEAVGTLLRRRPDSASRLRLVLVGDGPERPALEAAIQAEGLADIAGVTGWQDDVPALLASLDIFVLPSLNEGISNTILEAMACGLPVVATRVGGNPELVVDGETGYLFPVGDSASLADRLAAYLDEPGLRARQGEAARRRAETEFSMERMLGAYAELYRSLTRPLDRN